MESSVGPLGITALKRGRREPIMSLAPLGKELPRHAMELMTILGLLIALGGIIGGQLLEGGHPSALLALPPFLIVVLGSFGAVLVSVPKRDFTFAMRGFRSAVVPPRWDVEGMLDRIMDLAQLARREGLLALEAYATSPDSDPFLVKCLTLAIDGNSAESIRQTIETDLEIAEADARAGVRFWETWGSLCPTVGILGAVLGLIQVMDNLSEPAKIGPGIAIAFISTVYGVGFANVVFLPISFKLQRQLQHEMLYRSMILEGVVGIQSGMAPGGLRTRLEVYRAT